MANLKLYSLNDLLTKPATALAGFTTLDPTVSEATTARWIQSGLRGIILLNQLKGRHKWKDYNIEHVKADYEAEKKKSYESLATRHWETTRNAQNKVLDLKTQTRKQKLILLSLPYADYIASDSRIADTWDENGRDLYSYIEFQTIPKIIDVDPGSKWVAIATMGRNLAHYQYTGAEDTVEFEVTWYANTRGMDDVIGHCAYLEALSKSDGYDSPPRVVSLIWGDGYDFGLFARDTFIVEKAPYKLAQFNSGYKDPQTGQFLNTHMFPALATQTITLKKIAKSNPTWNDIEYTLEYVAKMPVNNPPVNPNMDKINQAWPRRLDNY